MVRSKGVCPHSVCRIIVGLCSIFVPISLCCKSKSHNQTPSAVDPLGFTSDSSPGRAGGSEEGASPSGSLFLQGQKAPDPEVASLLAPTKDACPRKYSVRPVCRGDTIRFGRLGFYALHLVQWNVTPGTSVKSWPLHQLSTMWSWEEECGARHAPLSPVTIQGLTGHWWLRAQHFKFHFLSARPDLQPSRSPAASPYSSKAAGSP